MNAIMTNRIEADVYAPANLGLVSLIHGLVEKRSMPIADLYQEIPEAWEVAGRGKQYAYTIQGEKVELAGYYITEDDVNNAIRFLLCDYLGYTHDAEPTLIVCPGGII